MKITAKLKDYMGTIYCQIYVDGKIYKTCWDTRNKLDRKVAKQVAKQINAGNKEEKVNTKGLKAYRDKYYEKEPQGKG